MAMVGLKNPFGPLSPIFYTWLAPTLIYRLLQCKRMIWTLADNLNHNRRKPRRNTDYSGQNSKVFRVETCSTWKLRLTPEGGLLLYRDQA